MQGRARILTSVLTVVPLCIAGCVLCIHYRIGCWRDTPLTQEEGLGGLYEFAKDHLHPPWRGREPEVEEYVAYTKDVLDWLEAYEKDCAGTANATTVRLLRAKISMLDATFDRPEGWTHAESAIEPVLDGRQHPVDEWQLAYAKWLRGRILYDRASRGLSGGRVDEEGVRRAVDLFMQDLPFFDKVGQVDDMGFVLLTGWGNPLGRPWNPRRSPRNLAVHTRSCAASWLQSQQVRLEPNGLGSTFGYSEEAARLYGEICNLWPGTEYAWQAKAPLMCLDAVLERRRDWRAWLGEQGCTPESLSREETRKMYDRWLKEHRRKFLGR